MRERAPQSSSNTPRVAELPATPKFIGSIVLEGNNAQGYYAHNSAGHIVPGPDGKHLYTGGGLFTNQTKRVPKIREPKL